MFNVIISYNSYIMALYFIPIIYTQCYIVLCTIVRRELNQKLNLY